MFFDLKAGRVAWVLANREGTITGGVPGSRGIIEAYPGLETFLSQWAQEWTVSPNEHGPFERSMDGRDALSGLQFEAVPLLPFDDAPRDHPLGKTGLTLIRVCVPEGRAENVSFLRERFALTAAECRVAAEIAEGRKPTEIARQLGLSVHTVRSHLKRIFVKAGVHSQAGLVRVLLQRDNTDTAPGA